MDFESLFGKTWKEYKLNFRQILLLTLVFIGIPLILSNIILYVMGMNDPTFYSAFMSEELDAITPSFAIILFLVYFVSIVLYMIWGAGLVKDSIKGKFEFHKTFASGKKNFWRFVWFNIVVIFFLIILFLLLIIPGIIFSVYWMVAIFVYLNGNGTVIQSLKSSYNMVKGNWWRLFGYTIILFIIIGVIGAVISLIGLPTALMVEGAANPSLGLLFLDFIMQDIANFIYTVFATPFGILFYKNIYLELRGKVKKKK